MSEKLVRFGVAMEASLLREFDELVEARGGTRSEALRDLTRAAVDKARVRRGAEAVATLTLVYDHHVRDLSEKLTELQHDLGSRIRSTLHVHLDHHHCLEVIVMHGRSDQLQGISERILALKGVKHGGLELFSGLQLDADWSSPNEEPTHAHAHGHARSAQKPRKTAAKHGPRAD
ncbi:MAG: nickel-responsive transcriptional regulator NikR [Polyangiaceae bacterium]